MIGNDGKPLDRAALRQAVAVYNSESRGSDLYQRLPRALITVLDGMTPGKTGYLKGTDGMLQVICAKDRKITAR